MEHKLIAKFDTFDDAERTAIEISRRIYGTKILSVRPNQPESLRLTQHHGNRFTLLPTAIMSLNYITALVESDYDFEDMNEPQKRQTSTAVIMCRNKSSAEAAKKIVIGKGGNLILTS